MQFDAATSGLPGAQPPPAGPMQHIAARVVVRIVCGAVFLALVALLIVLLPVGLAILAFSLAGMILFVLWTQLKARVRAFIHRHGPPGRSAGGPDPDGRENVRIRT